MSTDLTWRKELDYDRATLEVAKALLAKKGVRLQVYACSCCDNPEIKIEVDGELIADATSVNFSMFDE